MTEWIKQGNLTGPEGPVGPANELVIGEVETLPYTEPAWVEITPVTATPPYQVISFGIPQGLPGEAAIFWDDVQGKPDTFPPTTPIPWSDISGTPATFPPTLPIPWSGISGTPATFPPTLPIPWTSVSGKPTTFPPVVPISWTDITGQPATYPPAAHNHPQSEVTNLVADQAAQNTAIGLKAPLASPALTGAPTAPTAPPGTATTQIASTAFVGAAIAAIPPPPPGTTVSATAPSSPQTGAMWWNTTRKELNIWTGSAWEIVFGTWA